MEGKMAFITGVSRNRPGRARWRLPREGHRFWFIYARGKVEAEAVAVRFATPAAGPNW
jgi:hypothetical protein